MKKLVVVAVAVVVGFVGRKACQAKAAPVDTFKKFATAVAKGDHAEADKHAAGAVADKEAGERYRIVGWVPVQDLRSIRYDVKSSERQGDDVEIRATQKVGFNPPGVESAMRSAMTATFEQTATLHETGGTWKVVAFGNELKGAE